MAVQTALSFRSECMPLCRFCRHAANLIIRHRFRDLKCENLLLDNANHLKVTDFGFARTFEAGDISKTFCGSAAYAAPEILQGQPYHLPLHDVWAMGVILYIMVSSPFNTHVQCVKRPLLNPVSVGRLLVFS